jgi:hypothetical protein
MIRFLLDENFNGKIVGGLRARQPDVDMIRVQDTELASVIFIRDTLRCQSH